MDFKSLMAVAAQNKTKASKELEQKRQDREANKPPSLPMPQVRRPLPSSISSKSAISAQREQPRALPAKAAILPKQSDHPRKPAKADSGASSGKSKGRDVHRSGNNSTKSHGKDLQERQGIFEKASARSSSSRSVAHESGHTASPSKLANKADRSSVAKTPSSTSEKRTGGIMSKPMAHVKQEGAGENGKRAIPASKAKPRAPSKPVSFSSLMKMAEQQKSQPNDEIGGKLSQKAAIDEPVGRQLIEGRPRSSLPGKSSLPSAGRLSTASRPGLNNRSSAIPSSIASKRAATSEQRTDRPTKTASEVSAKASSIQMTDHLPWQTGAKSNGQLSASRAVAEKSLLAPARDRVSKGNSPVSTSKGPSVRNSHHPKKACDVREDTSKVRRDNSVKDRGLSSSKSSSSQSVSSRNGKGSDLTASRKRRRPPFMEDDWTYEDFADSEEVDVSKYIREIFGYDRRKFANEDPRDLPMESNFSSVLAEERRSARIGRLEDMEEEMRSEDLDPCAAKKKKKPSRPNRL